MENSTVIQSSRAFVEFSGVAPLGFGARAAQMRDNLYVVEYGHIYTTPCIQTEHVNRAYGMILLDARQESFELGIAGRRADYQAAVVKPLAKRWLSAVDKKLICFVVNAAHPHFRRFRAIERPGVLRMPRAAFSQFDAALDAAYRGVLPGRDANELFMQVLDVVARFLPTMPHLKDSRVEKAIAQLHADSDCSLDALAAQANLSSYRFSHLFASVVGLPLRNYQLWRKIYRIGGLLGADRSLTEIAHAAGFHDSQHLYRTFTRLFDAPPSYFLRSASVRCILAAHGHADKNELAD